MDYALAPAGIELLDRDLLGLGGDRRAHVVADRGLEELVEVQPPGPVEAGRHVRQDVEDDLDVGGHGQAGAVGEGDLLVLRAPLVGLLGIGVGALDRRVFDDPLADADEVPARAEGTGSTPALFPRVRMSTPTSPGWTVTLWVATPQVVRTSAATTSAA